MGCNSKKSKFTKKQWCILGIIGSVHFTSAICISLQAPFYPQEAESKNATSTEYGFVFGVYELVAFIASPILGSFMNEIGAKLILNTGILTAAVCSIFFGLLDLVESRIAFLVLSFVIRIVEALGSSAAVTSAFSITAAAFPNNVATVFATLEIFYGLGYIAGPTLGGILFSFGGYMLPFIFIGIVMLFTALAIYFVLPVYKTEENESKDNLLQILKVTPVLFDSAAVASLAICTGFYSATLEPHIRGFNLTPIKLGLVFIIHGGTYAVVAPFVGRMCDSFANPKYMILIGNIFCIISVILVGPLPGLPLEQSLSLVIPGLVFLGLGMACILVSAFIDAIRSSVDYGLSDGIKTYGLVSGLWAASFSLGDFIGPSVSGALFDLVGFRLGSLFIIIVHVIVFICMLTYICRSRCQKRQSAIPVSSLKECDPITLMTSFKSQRNDFDYGTNSKETNSFDNVIVHHQQMD